jgi:hypothetical protein
VAHAYHPKLHRRLRMGGSQFQASSWAKKFLRSHLNRKKAAYGDAYLSSQIWWEA